MSNEQPSGTRKLPVTPEERAEVEKYLHLEPGSEPDEFIRDVIDTGL